MTDITPELAQRMEALVRKLAAGCCYYGGLAATARAIVAELPEPVDPDLALARETVIDAMPSQGAVWAEAVRKGQMDDGNMVRIALSAVRRAPRTGGAVMSAKLRLAWAHLVCLVTGGAILLFCEKDAWVGFVFIFICVISNIARMIIEEAQQ